MKKQTRCYKYQKVYQYQFFAKNVIKFNFIIQRVTEISILILTGNNFSNKIFFFVNVLVNELKLFKIFQKFRYPPLETRSDHKCDAFLQNQNTAHY
jgi:hypothetical protein